MLQLKPKPQLVGGQAEPATKQRHRLLIALAILLVALIAVLIRDHEFWFGSEDAVESVPASQSIPATNTAATPIQPNQSSSSQTPALTSQNRVSPKASTDSVVTEHRDAKSASPASASKRAVIAPLRVDVIAQGAHHTAHTAKDVVKLENSSDSKLVQAVSTSVSSLPTNAAEREPLSGEPSAVLHQTVDTTYPLLGPRMKVQGSVVMQAVIGADGNIENLQVVSGPAILTAAAQQAVRQWRFKPYLQNGEPVETKATITVNFSIQIADNAAKTS